MSAVLSLFWPATSGLADPVPTIVTITPLGSSAGEFCRNSRVFLFDDPIGRKVHDIHAAPCSFDGSGADTNFQ